MRSELVYSAGLQIKNRFLLASTAMRAVRKLHVKATRTEDTINQVFTTVASGRPLVHKLPEIEPPPQSIALLSLQHDTTELNTTHRALSLIR